MAQRPTDPLVEEFLGDQDWVPANVANATGALNRFTAWCAAQDLDLLAVDRRHVRAYLAELKDAGRGPATVRTQWRYLRALYRWAAAPVTDGGGGELTADPMAGVRGPKVPTRPATKAARPDDVAALIASFPTTVLGRRNAAMVSLMWRSGLRSGELPHLDLAHYDVPADGRGVLLVPKTKTGEPRLVPVHPETARYLTRYLRRRKLAAGPLFLADGDRARSLERRLTATAIQDMVGRAASRAGVEVTCHMLRRGFTAQYLRSGGDVLSLEIIGGWADHRMPRRYLADEEAAAAVDRYFDVVDRPALRAVR